MATMITSECINCGACEPECPNTAIYQGGVEYELDGKLHPPLAEDIFYIVPEKCTECVGFYDQEACAAVCPVDCCVPNPDIPETEEELIAKARRLHPDVEFPASFPSRFKKEGASAAGSSAGRQVPASETGGGPASGVGEGKGDTSEAADRTRAPAAAAPTPAPAADVAAGSGGGLTAASEAGDSSAVTPAQDNGDTIEQAAGTRSPAAAAPTPAPATDVAAGGDGRRREEALGTAAVPESEAAASLPPGLPPLEEWDVPVPCHTCSGRFAVRFADYQTGTVLRCPYCHASLVVTTEMYGRVRSALEGFYRSWGVELEAFRERRERELREFEQRQQRALEQLQERLLQVAEKALPPGAPRRRRWLFG